MALASRFEKHRPAAMTGQKPAHQAETLIISCMDLCMSLHKLFGFDDGEVVISRIAGPMIPPYDEGSSQSQILQETLLIALTDMRVRNIAILGHTQCKTAKKLSESIYCSGDIFAMKKLSEDVLQNALTQAGESDQQALSAEIEKQIIIQSIKNLFDYPVVQKAIGHGNLTVEGLQIDAESGKLFKLNTDGRGFTFDLVAQTHASEAKVNQDQAA